MAIKFIILFSSWLLKKIGDKAFEKIAGSLNKSEIDKEFKKAVNETSNQLQKKYPNILGNSIEDFFSNGAVYDTIYKLLFKEAIIDEDIIKKELDTSTLPIDFVKEFIQLLKENCNGNLQLNEILSNNKLYITIIGISEDTYSIAKTSTLSYDVIQEIRNLLIKTFNEQFVVEDFKEKYYKAALIVLSELNFIGLGLKSHIKKNRKKLSDVYVEPNFVKNDEKNQFITTSDIRRINPNEIISLKEIFNIPNNIVILGNPGSGKSVLVKHLICIILEKNCSSQIDNFDISSRIPFRIELRKYFQFKKNSNEGILNFLIKNLETDYGILNLTKNNIETLFNHSNSLIFFDGLDEIFDATDKVTITTDIESLLINYPKILSVVTSRLIGYDEAKLSSENFTEIKILDFNDNQIHEYVNKWYLQEEKNSETRNREVSQFLRLYKQVDEELIRNPLLLSLIIILFRNNLRLPESKLEIYQSCTKTLVDMWDLTKNLEIELPEEIAKRKETLFADLAFWQYEKLSSKNVKITNRSATNAITEVIINKLKITDDFIIANSLAEKFMNYALRRSLYFDNSFTHKTFLEYFTAYWIFSNVEKKLKLDARNELISKYIDVPFWFIVLELLINMIDQDQPDTEIIDELFKFQITTKPTGLPFLLEITPFLKNISKARIKDLVDAILNFLITETIRNTKVKVQRHFQSLINFINHSEDQLQVFKDKFYEFSRSLKDESSLTLLIQLYLELLANYRNGQMRFEENAFFDYKNAENLINNSPELYYFYYLIAEREKNQNIFYSSLNFLSKFGNSQFLKEYHLKYDNYQLQSPFISYLHWQLQKENLKSFEVNMNSLFKNGLSKINVFKILKRDDRILFYYQFPSEYIKKFIIDPKKDSFLKFILLAVLKSSRSNFLHESLKFDTNSILSLLMISDYNQFIEKVKQELNLSMFDVDK